MGCVYNSKTQQETQENRQKPTQTGCDASIGGLWRDGDPGEGKTLAAGAGRKGGERAQDGNEGHHDRQKWRRVERRAALGVRGNNQGEGRLKRVR